MPQLIGPNNGDTSSRSAAETRKLEKRFKKEERAKIAERADAILNKQPKPGKQPGKRR